MYTNVHVYNVIQYFKTSIYFVTLIFIIATYDID